MNQSTKLIQNLSKEIKSEVGRAITKWGAIEKSPILPSQYWKNEIRDGNIIISYFDGSNNIFADCFQELRGLWSGTTYYRFN